MVGGGWAGPGGSSASGWANVHAQGQEHAPTCAAPPTAAAARAPAAHAETAAAYACGVTRTPAEPIASSTSTATCQRPAPSAACSSAMNVAWVRSQPRAVMSCMMAHAASMLPSLAGGIGMGLGGECWQGRVGWRVERQHKDSWVDSWACWRVRCATAAAPSVAAARRTPAVGGDGGVQRRRRRRAARSGERREHGERVGVLGSGVAGGHDDVERARLGG
jgi:hypothetical protein